MTTQADNKERKEEFTKDIVVHELLSTLFCDGWTSHISKDTSGELPIKSAKDKLYNWHLKKMKERDEKLKQNIGMLRQWLNEDRITDISRMVTNEDILMWLNDNLKNKL